MLHNQNKNIFLLKLTVIGIAKSKTTEHKNLYQYHAISFHSAKETQFERILLHRLATTGVA